MAVARKITLFSFNFTFACSEAPPPQFQPFSAIDVSVGSSLLVTFYVDSDFKNNMGSIGDVIYQNSVIILCWSLVVRPCPDSDYIEACVILRACDVANSLAITFGTIFLIPGGLLRAFSMATPHRLMALLSTSFGSI